MELQFVYGNPKKVSKKRKKKTKRGKKVLASGRKIKNNKPNEGASVAKKKKARRKKSKASKVKKQSRRKVSKKSRTKKRAAKKSADKKVTKRRSRRKKKNPERYKFSATNSRTGEKIKDRVGKARHTAGELARRRAALDTLAASAKIKSEYAHGKKPKARKKIRRKSRAVLARVKKARAKVKSLSTARRASIKEDKQMRADLRTAGWKVRGRKEVGAKLGKKRKGNKKTKRNPIFGGGNMVDVVKRAVTGGMDKYELGALALGGALYPITAASLAKFAPAVYQKVAALNIPGGAGVGVNFLVGAIAYAVGEKLGNKAAQSVGKGLIAAAAVGVAAVAGQWAAKQANLVPGVTPLAELPDGYGDADFGDADFGGVDYSMEGVDYSLEGDQMGDSGADFGGVDYSMEGYDGVPEGLGEGQMG